MGHVFFPSVLSPRLFSVLGALVRGFSERPEPPTVDLRGAKNSWKKSAASLGHREQAAWKPELFEFPPEHLLELQSSPVWPRWRWVELVTLLPVQGFERAGLVNQLVFLCEVLAQRSGLL